MTKYLMDGCKLKWHPDRVQAWRAGGRIAPIHIDVGLSKGCNIHCEYCFGTLQGNKYKKGKDICFPKTQLLEYVKDAGFMGVRSMAFIGEGEPLLNPHITEAAKAASEAGVDVSLGTNGTLLDDFDILKYLKWIRFNISAASEPSYYKIHGANLFSDFLSVVKTCLYRKKKFELPITIGFQSVLIPNNVNEMPELSRIGRELGIDYHVIKQCSDTTAGQLGVYDKLNTYSKYADILKKSENESTDTYSVIVKWNMIGNNGNRNYKRCLGVPFLLYSSGDGRLFPCGMFFDYKSDEYCMGDLKEQSFVEIWESDRYWDIVDKVSKLDVSKCYSNCRTHYVNEYLWELKHPPEHVNFV